jgi:hypothetical protein
LDQGITARRRSSFYKSFEIVFSLPSDATMSVIAKIETGQRRLDVIALIRIADVVGFDAARLVRDVQQIMAKADGR